MRKLIFTLAFLAGCGIRGERLENPIFGMNQDFKSYSEISANPKSCWKQMVLCDINGINYHIFDFKSDGYLCEGNDRDGRLDIILREDKDGTKCITGKVTLTSESVMISLLQKGESRKVYKY